MGVVLRYWIWFCVLCCVPLVCDAQSFEAGYTKAYRLALKLKADSARLLTSTPDKYSEVEAQRLLIQSLTDMIENLVREEDAPKADYFDRQEARMNALEEVRKPGPWVRHALAECYQHKAMVQGRYGMNVRAGLTFTKGYFKAKSIHADYPAFLPATKSHALYQMIIGLMPTNDNLVLKWIGFKGDVEAGFANLKTCAEQPNAQQAEATLYYSLAQMYLRDQPEQGRANLLKYIGPDTDDLAAMTLLASVYKEGHQNGRALAAIQATRKDESHLPFYYPLLLEGEVHLNALDYDKAIVKLEQYLAVCSKKRLVKQLHFKLFVAHHLRGDSIRANAHFYSIETEGEVGTDGDRYALYFAKRGLVPDKRLLRARVLFDGGYDARAQATLDSIAPSSLRTNHEVTELVYRRARLAQHRNDTASAMRLLQLTISTAEQDPSYYAPMACIQLGKYYLKMGQLTDAAAWYERAKTYPEHEYKTGLDERANNGLKRVRKAEKAMKK